MKNGRGCENTSSSFFGLFMSFHITEAQVQDGKTEEACNEKSGACKKKRKIYQGSVLAGLAGHADRKE